MHPWRPAAGRLLALLGLLGLSACSTDDWCRRFNLDCVVEAPLVLDSAVDADGDIWPAGADCDDLDPETYPGAVEVCDGRDNDCDGLVDEGTDGERAWYPDSDYDGYGAEVDGLLACESPPGWTSVSGDCDDADYSVHPGAVETCDEVDRDCDGDPTEGAVDGILVAPDEDGDGFGDGDEAVESCSVEEGWVVLVGPNSFDCDDSNAEVFPFADETCNLRDDDCDGEIDEPGSLDPVELGYPDADGDGYGDSASPVGLCGPAEGYVLDGTDCDDTNAAIYPGAPECINGGDEDCDGVADNDADPAPRWYRDTDGDGFGGLTGSFVSCFQPTGFVDNSEDCDDTSALINPDGTETCTAGDEDCDGLQGELDPSLDLSTATSWYTDADGDGYGDPSSVPTVSCGPPPGTSASSDDCDDEDATRYPAAPEICGSGVVEDCDGDPAVAEARCALEGEVGEDHAAIRWTSTYLGSTDLGASLAQVDDVDGDGLRELLLGDPSDSRGGAAYLVSGASSGREPDLATDALGTFTGDASGDQLGRSLAFLEDWGDAGTYAFGAPYNDYAYADGGTVWLLEGPVTGSVDLADEALAVVGRGSSDYFGYALASGVDATGDGAEDLLVGSLYADLGATNSGGAYLFTGPLSSSRFASTADATFGALSTATSAGSRVAMGDLDGDGVGEVIFSAPGDDTYASNAGAVYLFSGPVSGETTTTDAVTIYGTASSCLLGAAQVVDDVDGDGLSDLLLGATGYRPSSTTDGGAFVLRGPVTVNGRVDARAWAVVEGTSTEGLGESVAGAGDVDGDGLEDLLLGAPNTLNDGVRVGAVYRMVGLSSGTSSSADAATSVYGNNVSGFTDQALLGGMDLDADGVPDMVLGGTGLGNRAAGAVLLYQVQDY